MILEIRGNVNIEESFAGSRDIRAKCSTNDDCKVGLFCVQNTTDPNNKTCSDLKNNNYCDITLKQCDTGLKCVNYITSGTSLGCTDGKEDSFCATNSDCNSGLKCTNVYGIIKRCTDGSNGDYCSTNTDCQSELECVEEMNTNTGGIDRYCSNLKLNSYCDSTERKCNDGLTCKMEPVNITTYYKCRTPDSGSNNVACGQIDVNSDNKLDLIDYAAFSKVFNKKCSDTSPTTGCKGKDVDSNGEVNVIDFASFAKRWYPNTQKNCTL